MISRGMNVLRAVSSEGFGRIRYHTELRRRLEADWQMRRYFDQETTELPQFYLDRVRKDLGPLWEFLPDGALRHDPNAYLHKTQQRTSRGPGDLGAGRIRRAPTRSGTPFATHPRFQARLKEYE